jgi:GNAT superfamily N-acetyltransferase
MIAITISNSIREKPRLCLRFNIRLPLFYDARAGCGVEALCRRSIDQTALRFVEHRAFSLGQTRERIQSVAGGSFVFGAFDGDALVGTAGFWREKQPKLRHKGMVWGVYVKPEHRGQGLARSLMAALLDRVCVAGEWVDEYLMTLRLRSQRPAGGAEARTARSNAQPRM